MYPHPSRVKQMCNDGKVVAIACVIATLIPVAAFFYGVFTN
jgi:hypothetical protein